MKNPVVRLEKALYGHKHSGVFCQHFCNKQVTEAGFEPLGESWPCAYFHPVTKMLLIVYVDDMKLAGPTEHMAATWKALGKNIKLEVPKGDTTAKAEKKNGQDKDASKDDGADEVLSKMTFLGCTLKRFERRVGKKTLQCIEYDVEDSLKKALDKYEEVVESLTGKRVGYHDASTPFLEEPTKGCRFRAPCDTKATDFVECPSCLHSIALEDGSCHVARHFQGRFPWPRIQSTEYHDRHCRQSTLM